MSDPKARKVIVMENTFLPQFVKEQIARALFENLKVGWGTSRRPAAGSADSFKVPSVSFTPSSVLALAACGRITGLVIDCGCLETSVTPVRSSAIYSRGATLLTRSRCFARGLYFTLPARHRWLADRCTDA